MRGVDFRGGVKGLCLIIDTPFENEREALQACARVGRMQEKCERYLTHSTTLISDDLGVEFTTRMLRLVEQVQKHVEVKKPTKAAKPSVPEFKEIDGAKPGDP